MILYFGNGAFYFFIFLCMSTRSSHKSPQTSLLSRITFRNILLLALGVGIWVGGTLSIYSATDNTISNIVTMVNTQCKEDIACIREVATGLERAVETLTSVVSELRTQVANTPTSTAIPWSSPPGTISSQNSQSPSNQASPGTSSSQAALSGEDLGCYYRMTDISASNDQFKDLIQTYRIDHKSKVTGIASSKAKCARVTLTCADTKIEALDATWSPIQIPFTRIYVQRNNGTDRRYLIHASQSGAYLGDSVANCERSEEYRQTVDSVAPWTSASISTTIVDNKPPQKTISTIETPVRPSEPITSDYAASPTGSSSPTLSTRLSPSSEPAKSAVASIAAWSYTSEWFQCPLSYPQDGYYSSYYQCRSVVVSCDADNKITTNLWSLRNILSDANSRSVYNSVSYPQYLGKSYDDCKIALTHSSTLERAWLYK